MGKNGKVRLSCVQKKILPARTRKILNDCRDGTIKIVPKLEETTDEKCEKCSSPMVIKSGHFSRISSPVPYPGHKTTKAIALGVKCPQPVAVERSRSAHEKGENFYSCGRYRNVSSRSGIEQYCN